MWDLDFDEADGFVPMSFGDSFDSGFQDFNEQPFEAPSFFQTSQPPVPEAAPAPCPWDSQGLVERNNELRQTALSLKEKFTQMSTLNERLKSQLEECRSNFRSVMFSGFNNSRK